MIGAESLSAVLSENGYLARMDTYAWDREPNDSEAIWIDAGVPASIAVDVIRKAHDVWPFLRYVHLTADSGAPVDETSIYLGGASATAVGSLRCMPWTDADFRQLRADMSDGEFHSMVRARYRSA